jgi:DNA gyrase/topoisomerase IV subunit A
MSNHTVVPNAKSTKVAMLAWIEEREQVINSILLELKKSKEEISLLEGMVKTLQHTDELNEQLIKKLEEQIELLSSSNDVVCREMPEEYSDARPDWLISLSKIGFNERGLLICWEKELVVSHFNQTYYRLSMNRATLEQFKKKANELNLEFWTSVTGQTWEFKWRK